MEMDLHWLSFFTAVAGFFGNVILRSKRNPKLGFSDVAMLVALIISLGLVGAAWVLSDATFFACKIRTTPTATWDAAAKEMDTFGARVIQEDDDDFWFPIEKEDLSSVFDPVGMRNEYGFGRAQMDTSGKPQADVLIVYGYKSRRWGLYQGERVNLVERWPYARINAIRENLLFFVTPD
ncbi:MAG: hypothetical protein IH623_27770 [Verrucomicrobia bacterium]|nr:hypothetical protein [Verrucomicrobiota bacterium]